MSHAHFFGLHRACGKENFRRGAMRILLEEMMLDGPDGIEAQFIGQRDLFEAVIENPFFGFAVPWARYRDLIEDSEFHRVTPCHTGCLAQSDRQGKGLPER